MQWKYEPCGDSDGEVIGIDHFVIDENGDEIACPRNEKTARLISAAPDLLAACELFLRRWGGYDFESVHDAAMLSDIQAAVKKAKGE